MSSIFTKIVNGEIPCYKIAEDENYLAFLGKSKCQRAYTLYSKFRELIKYLMDEAHYLVTHFSRKIAITLEQAFFASASVCQ
jgi:histidine triad (HIT) family protein